MSRTIKPVFYIGLLLCLLALHSCSDDPLPGGPYWGFVSATRNGEPWSGNLRGLEQNNQIGFLALKHNKDGFLRESLSVRKISKIIGTYNIPKTDTINLYNHVTSFHSTLEDDGDVILDVYFVDSNDPTHFVEVTSYNSGTGEFSGKFQVSFVRDSRRAKRHPSIPDTIRFTNGKFKTRILQKL